MENASKALLIAGGILISIVLITLLVNTYSSISGFKKQEITEKEIQQIEEENREYTKYLGQTVYGTEVITVINRAASSKSYVNVEIAFQNNNYTYTVKTRAGEKTYTVKKLTMEEILPALNQGIDSKSSNFGSRTNNENTTIISGLKEKAFKCDDIKYDNSTGRVNYIHFKELKIQ